MLTYEENVKAILECCFPGYKEELINDACKSICALKCTKKQARWIPTEYDGYADGNPVYNKWECSKCGWEHSGDKESLTAFCPNCGFEMLEV